MLRNIVEDSSSYEFAIKEHKSQSSLGSDKEGVLTSSLGLDREVVPLFRIGAWWRQKHSMAMGNRKEWKGIRFTAS